VLDVVNVEPVPIPIDCTDGFGAAFWGRPEVRLPRNNGHGLCGLLLASQG
jgi:hypothetical protein